ncbi:MAG: IS3 family transposase [Solirubrobacterales bacterium]
MSEEKEIPLAAVCRIAGVSRSAACERRRRRRQGRATPTRKRGPVGAMPDAELRAEIHAVIETSPFTGEGHRKVWARLRRRGTRTARKRVLRLMREDGVLAPTPQVRKRAARLHEGTITVEAPDTLWATDATEGWSDRDGRCAVFCIVDHGSGELFFDAAARMNRSAAADLLREVTAERFGSVEAAVASGLALRYDGGPCFRSHHYQAEIDHLGIARSPAYHYEPETNGCAERAIQVLKEQLLWIRRFETFEQLRAAVRGFGPLYSSEWLLERHGYRTPIEAREHLLAQVMA